MSHNPDLLIDCLVGAWGPLERHQWDKALADLSQYLRSDRVRREFLQQLAVLFAPDGRSEFKFVLKRRQRGQPRKEFEEHDIASEVNHLREAGKTYDEAAAEVAAGWGKSPERVKTLYGRHYDHSQRAPRRRRKSKR